MQKIPLIKISRVQKTKTRTGAGTVAANVYAMIYRAHLKATIEQTSDCTLQTTAECRIVYGINAPEKPDLSKRQ